MNENNDKSGKSFLAGLISGALITCFIGVLVLSIAIISGNNRGLAGVLKAQAEDVAAGAAAKKDTSVLADKETVEKVMTIESIIKQNFIEDLDKETLADGVYSGLISALDDPYAAYYTQDELIKLTQSTQGIYYGIGAYVQIDQETGCTKISNTIKDTPAEEAGLVADDIIYMVDDTETYGMALDDVVALIKGPEGTTVHLTIVRQSASEKLEFDVERRKVESPTVTYEKKDDGIAYIDIQEFDVVTVDQFKKALEEARADGMKGLIIDLRGNPGGSLTAVVDIANQILPKGLVVYTKDKYGKKDEYTSDGKHELEVPLVVLVNGGSASASEILSGAVKDYGIGTLVGTTTYGKGIVQRVVGLNDGSAVKLTVSHYYTPLGNDIHKVGIVPDVEVELDTEKYLEDRSDNQYDKAVEVLKEKMN